MIVSHLKLKVRPHKNPTQGNHGLALALGSQQGFTHLHKIKQAHKIPTPHK
jgi:hypothetical protein